MSPLVAFARAVFARVVLCATATAPESAIRREITLAGCFIMASFLVPATIPTIGDRLHCRVVAFYDDSWIFTVKSSVGFWQGD